MTPRTCFAVCVFGLLGANAVPAFAGCDWPGMAPANFIVTLTPEVAASSADARKTLLKQGLVPKPGTERSNRLIATAIDDKTVSRLLALKKLPKGFIALEPLAQPVSANPSEAAALVAEILSGDAVVEQWHRKTIGIEVAQRQVARLASVADRQQVAAIIDSGVDLTHAALLPRAWKDPNSLVPVHGMDFTRTPPGTQLVDHGSDSHGTHVAGIIFGDSGRHNGLKPLAPDARFISLAIGKGYCIEPAAAAAAIDYASTHGAAVANLSWSTTGQSLRPNIERAERTLFVVSAPNDNKPIDYNPSYPVWFDLPNIITVEASGENDRRPTGSGRRIDIAAPGTDILSASKGGKIVAKSGTSSAAPMVTGTALLLKALAPGWRPEQIKRYLIDSAFHPPRWEHLGYGRLDAARATAAPIVVTWPPDGTAVASNDGTLAIKWHALFATRECPYLQAELKTGNNGYQPVRAAVEPIATAANRADILVSPGLYQSNLSIRLRCKDTQLEALSGTFSAAPVEQQG